MAIAMIKAAHHQWMIRPWRRLTCGGASGVPLQHIGFEDRDPVEVKPYIIHRDDESSSVSKLDASNLVGDGLPRTPLLLTPPCGTGARAACLPIDEQTSMAVGTRDRTHAGADVDFRAGRQKALLAQAKLNKELVGSRKSCLSTKE
ncbi:hypothetical protein D3227_05745 [Mesorhizobium waimense]|uniref:Uncharacterized protein n=1 Tax=Mesorhizobium waimense TaxID=1300307 RepID=A0A3A5L3X0_9HYPH|nr:hypothetical protein [Mesorhizobium waimense]RJT41303.1 hypothetical protein D3227_05745 [Mesorhizobium waimense]